MADENELDHESIALYTRALEAVKATALSVCEEPCPEHGPCGGCIASVLGGIAGGLGLDDKAMLIFAKQYLHSKYNGA